MGWWVMKSLMIVSAILTLPVTGFAQEAAISGTVSDQTGGVLPGVTITATHEATGNTFVGVTDERGAYRLPVRTGTFRIAVELSGFATIDRTIELLVGQNAVVNLQMVPSTLQESITVSATAPLIDTTNSSVGTNIDPRQMQELPVNGRNWVDLTMLAAGSRQNAVNETPVTNQTTTVQFQLNIDGQQVTNLVAVGFGQPRFSRDAIGEFEFVANRFDASQGHSSGVQVNAITKSGTNAPGGSFSGYFRNDKFNAADPVAKVVLPYSDQQISATFGGPIIRDKFHYFAGYEYEREPQTYVYTTPYPEFNTSLTGTRREDKEVFRLDYQFSTQSRLTFRGTRYDNRLPYDPRYTGGADRTPASAIGVNRRSEQILATLTQVLGTRALNQVKVGHDGFHWNQYPHVKNPNTLPGMLSGLGAANIQLRGFTLGQSHAITPQDIGQDNYLARDDFSYSFTKGGRHDLKTGAEYIYNFTFETVCNQCMGVLDLQGGPVPSNLESLIGDVNDVSTWNLAPLSSIARSYSRAIGMSQSPYSRPTGNHGFTEYAPRHDVAFWIQDDWQISRKLTLNLGLRYDLSYNQYVNWVVFPPLLPGPGARPNDLNNFGPRVGFAYSMTDRTVIRGGFGKYYAEVTGQPAVFTLRNVQQINPLITYDGRADFASNPFNGPAPTYEQAANLLCSVSTASNCLRPSVSNFVAPDLVQPFADVRRGRLCVPGQSCDVENPKYQHRVQPGDGRELSVHRRRRRSEPAGFPFSRQLAGDTRGWKRQQSRDSSVVHETDEQPVAGFGDLHPAEAIQL
jgi:Carboxypeptidase regulatory-like domain/TonB dependent receptor-like, beta-barrel